MTDSAASPPAAAAAAGFRVLLIGIDGYRDIPLQGCVNDIQAMEKFLLNELQVPAAAITKLLAPLSPAEPSAAQLPTKARITAELKTLATAPEIAQSQVLVYYSGHGTQRYFSQAEANYEALVPVDYDREPASLLFDFELAPMLQAIAQSCLSLTVILDCCNSAGILSFSADEEEASSRRSRFLPSNDHPSAPLPTPPVVTAKSPPRWATAPASQYTILAAAQSNEPAEELAHAEAEGSPRGALSYALLQLLSTQFRGRLSGLRWAELWQPLRAELRRLGTSQHPHFLGSLGSGVFSQGAAIYDNALPVQSGDDGSFVLTGGELAGLGPGATVAVYAPLIPPTFAPLGSPQDLADRLGVVVVASSDSWSAVAQPLAGTTLPLSGAGRGRLLTFGAPARLRVGFAKSCPEWVQAALTEQADELGILCLPQSAAAPNTGDATDPEVLIGQDDSGALLLGDRVYSCDPGSLPGPLGTIPLPVRLDPLPRQQWMLRALRSALQHHSHYVVPGRLARLAERPESPLPASSLDLAAVEGRDPNTISAMVQDARQIHELRPDASGRIAIPEGFPVCFRVHNNSWFPLFVTLVLADSQGRLRQLAPPQQIAPSTGSFIWPAGSQADIPFQFACDGRPVSIERVFALATNSPEVDFRWLDDRLTLKQAIAWDTLPRIFVDALAGPPPPPLTWTATELQLAVRPL